MKTIGVGDVGLQRFNSRSSVTFKHFKNQASNSHLFIFIIIFYKAMTSLL